MEGLYIRFEMAFNGEEQGVGFMSGLDDTGMDEEEVEELLAPFNGNLKIPPYYKWAPDSANSAYYPGAYFTKNGYLRYQEDINRMIEAVKQRDNGWEVIAIHSHGFHEDDLYYEDDEQVVARTYYMENAVI